MTIDSARVEPTRLPDPVVERIHDYVDRLGLVYGAIDMRRTPDGRYVFLEINPSGQWLFVEERTGQPMTETFARLLARHDSERGAGSRHGSRRAGGSRRASERAAAAQPTAADAAEPTAWSVCSGPGKGAAAGSTRYERRSDSTDQEPQPGDSGRERGSTEQGRDPTTESPSS